MTSKDQDNILLQAFIDARNEKDRKSIELLKERRSALIAAAVTGKIDVRNAL